MSDIAKCNGANCDKKETCWRYLAPDGQMQSYIMPLPEDCKMYWKVEKDKK